MDTCTYHATGCSSEEGVQVMNSCLGGQEGVWQQLEYVESVSLCAGRHQQTPTKQTEIMSQMVGQGYYGNLSTAKVRQWLLQGESGLMPS